MVPDFNGSLNEKYMPGGRRTHVKRPFTAVVSSPPVWPGVIIYDEKKEEGGKPSSFKLSIAPVRYFVFTSMSFGFACGALGREIMSKPFLKDASILPVEMFSGRSKLLEKL
jgi:hypothetical protein